MPKVEIVLGNFMERTKRWGIYVTSERIFAIDVGKAMIRSIVVLVVAAFAYLSLFLIFIPLILRANIFLPILILVGLVPFLFAVGRLVPRYKLGMKPATDEKKFEIGRERILQIEIQRPGVVTGWGKLVVRPRSGGSIEFRIVGRRQLKQVKALAKKFCIGSSIRIIET